MCFLRIKDRYINPFTEYDTYEESLKICRDLKKVVYTAFDDGKAEGKLEGEHIGLVKGEQIGIAKANKLV